MQSSRTRHLIGTYLKQLALQSLSVGQSDTTTRQLLSHQSCLSEHNNVVLQWIPAHVGIAGNEYADKLAKEGSRKEQPQPPISYKEAKTLLKCSFRTIWKNKNEGYQSKTDNINKLNRPSQVTFFRLRTDHCRLHKHIKGLGLAETASCQCRSDDETRFHILQNCPNLEKALQTYWPTETSYNDKLWGSTEDLRRTVQFVTASRLQAI